MFRTCFKSQQVFDVSHRFDLKGLKIISLLNLCMTQTADVSAVGRVHHLCVRACLRLKHLTQSLAASVGFPDCIREIDQTVRRALCVLFCALGQCAVLKSWPVRWTSTSWKPYDAAAAYGNHTVYPKMLHFWVFFSIKWYKCLRPANSWLSKLKASLRTEILRHISGTHSNTPRRCWMFFTTVAQTPIKNKNKKKCRVA